MSDRLSLGNYSLEITDREVVVRDQRGTVLETVALDTLNGTLTLPDGHSVDIASLLADADRGLTDLNTAAGPGGTGNFGPTGTNTPTTFRAFTDSTDGFVARQGAGTLGNTSLRYGAIDGESKPEDEKELLLDQGSPALPFAWSSHDPWQIPENQSGGELGRVVDGDAQDFTFQVSDPRFEVIDGVLQLKAGESFDYESEPFVDLVITATSNTGGTHSQPVRIDIVDQNEAPTDIGLDNTAVQENAPGAVIGNLTVVDPDAGDGQTFAVSDSRFEVVDGQLKLKDGVALDFEAEPAVTVTVTATDKGGHSIAEQFTINVGDINEAQSALSLDGAYVAENAAGAVIGNLTVVDPDAGDSQTFTVSDSRFEVVDGQLKLKDGVALDFEAEPAVTVTVTATDKGGHSIAEQFTINVGDVNEAQTALSLDGAYVAENAAGAVIGSLTVVDPDAGDGQTFAVSDNRFEVVDGQLKLKDGVALDFESEPIVNVTVTATDKGGHSIAEQFTLGVGDVNEAQTAMSIDHQQVAENAAGAVIGTLAVVDPDAGDSQTFQVSDNRFEVVDGQLKLKDGVALDFESEPQVDVTVTATDKAGHQIQQTIAVAVTNVNEAPLSLTLNTTGTQLLVNGSFEANKLNNGQWKLFNAIDGWKTDTQAEIQNNVTNKASNGAQMVELDADRAVDNLYQTVKTAAGHAYELTFDTATRNDTKHTDTIDVYWNGVKIGTVDPQSTAWQTSTFQVIGTGGADRLEFRETSGNNDSYGGLLDNVALKGMGSSVPENFAGVVIGDLVVTDPDAGDSHTFAVSDNRFEVVDGQLKLKDGVSFNYEAEQSVNVTVTATDTGGNTIQKTFAISVVDVNEAQTALAWNGKSVAENAAGAAVGTLSVADPDAGDSQTFTVSDSRFQVVNNQLQLKSGVSLNYEAEPSVNVTVTATDKAGHQISQTVTVNVTDVNEAPTAILLSNATVAENAAGANIGKLSTVDPDAGDTFSYQVSDSRFQVANGQLQLKSGVAFDYETEPSVNLKVTSTDSAGHSIQQSFTVSVTNVNEAPTVTVKDGSVETHIVNTSTAYNPSADATVGAYLYSNDSAGVKVPSSSLLNGVSGSNMTLTAPTEVTVTFQKEAAGNRNMVGTYQYDDEGNIIPGTVKFVWLDASATTEGKLGAIMVKDFLGYAQANTVSLGTLAAGAHVGFFTISNGAADGTNTKLLGNAAAGAANQAAAMDAIASQLSIKVDASGNGHVYVGNSQMNGDVFFSHDKTLNTDFSGGKDIDHMASGVNASLASQLLIGVEDLNGGGDRDYNDVVFSVNLGTYNVVKTTQSVVQPSVDFADIDSHALSQAVIHSSGFQSGDALNVPASGQFNVNVAHSGNDMTITITGKTGSETVDQYESFVNSITFSTSSKAEGDRNIDYSIVDEGGLSSTIGHAHIGVANSYEISSSQLAANQNALGAGDDHLYLNSGLTGHLDFGTGYDTLHLARNGDSLGHSELSKLDNIEAIDMTGFGNNKVALSIVDVLDMTDADHRLTVVGDKGDVVTLSGDGSGHHWTVVDTGDDFTTYAWSDPIHQAVVEISNQLTAQLG